MSGLRLRPRNRSHKLCSRRRWNCRRWSIARRAVTRRFQTVPSTGVSGGAKCASRESRRDWRRSHKNNNHGCPMAKRKKSLVKQALQRKSAARLPEFAPSCTGTPLCNYTYRMNDIPGGGKVPPHPPTCARYMVIFWDYVRFFVLKSEAKEFRDLLPYHQFEDSRLEKIVRTRRR